MKYIIILMFISFNVEADGFYVFGGGFSYNDNSTEADYKGLSPNGYLGIKYVHFSSSDLFIQVGFKHESSVGYREIGSGFNGLFADFNLKIN